MSHGSRAIMLILLLATTSACGRKNDANQDTAMVDTVTNTSASAPASDGQVIDIAMITDDASSRFEPSQITAKPGDVLRFTLKTGAHNVSFPADRNPVGPTLPPVGEMLQLPGQTYDVAVNFPAGEYYFQCDPHAALGMVGTLIVQ